MIILDLAWTFFHTNKTLSEAFTTHGFNGWAVLIHIWNTSSSPPTLIECNCPQIYGTPGHSEERVRNSSISYMSAQPPVIPAPVPTLYASLPGATPVYGSTQMLYVPASATPVLINPMVPTSVALASAPYYYPTTTATNPIYSTGANGMPVDVTRGSVPTVARRVHFTNLDYSVREEELRTVIRQHAEPLNVDISRRQNGASQGWAIAEFGSGAEAQLVVARLNNSRLGSRVMKVKLDANRSVVSEPVIANGSMVA